MRDATKGERMQAASLAEICSVKMQHELATHPFRTSRSALLQPLAASPKRQNGPRVPVPFHAPLALASDPTSYRALFVSLGA